MRMLKFVIPFIPYVMYSGEKGFKKGLKKFFKDERLHKIFASDTELLGCLVPIGWAYYGDFQSPPKGGSQMIPKWLQYVVEHYKNHVYFKNAKCCRYWWKKIQAKVFALSIVEKEYQSEQQICGRQLLI